MRSIVGPGSLCTSGDKYGRKKRCLLACLRRWVKLWRTAASLPPLHPHLLLGTVYGRGPPYLLVMTTTTVPLCAAERGGSGGGFRTGRKLSGSEIVRNAPQSLSASVGASLAATPASAEMGSRTGPTDSRGGSGNGPGLQYKGSGVSMPASVPGGWVCDCRSTIAARNKKGAHTAAVHRAK